MFLVTGAAGFLGRTVLRHAAATGREVVASVRSGVPPEASAGTVQADLTDRAVVREMIASVRPRWVLNCAALANLDDCEQNPSKARAANVTAPANLAAACLEFGARLLHISTDQVFDGLKGSYSEDDVPSPINVYGRSKLDGERAVRETLPGALVVRTNFIGIPAYRGAGLGDWIATSVEAGTPIKGFDDVIFSPLLSTTLASLLFDMMDADLQGLYHQGASDSMSKYELAVAIARELGHDGAKIERAFLEKTPMAVPRPLKMSLVSARAEKALGISLPTVYEAVRGFISERKGSTNSQVVA